MTPQQQELVSLIQGKAENLFATGELYCSEAVLVALNQGLNGGLDRQQAVGLAAGYAMGLGESGCLCGAVGGGVLALGLLLGQEHAYRHRAEIRSATAELHRRFKEANRSTCCRVLSRQVKDDPKAHMAQCTGFTGQVAAMAAEMVLERRPHLALDPASPALRQRHGRVWSLVRRLAAVISGRF